MTLAEIAGRIELTRGSTRRLLLTLEHLGPRKHQKPPHTGFVTHRRSPLCIRRDHSTVPAILC
ncbi:helix-turn-helix domain-containing protein [Bradyrhizobium sp.]|uniref:helix-turn-helix domain-containing protein n=1 Tax=Bradyrhizobium sp. TaxID=376 RepID=UPI003C733F92